jgi:hypothetical protein
VVVDRDERTEHPVLAGLAALVGVALSVGLVLGLVALAATQVLGLGGDSGTQGATSQASLYLPRPERTKSPSGPQITLDQQASQSPSAGGRKARQPKKQPPISLSAGQTAVSSMGQIDLTGTFPGGEGAVLRVQRFTGGWQDFPVTASVSDSTFSTYVQSSQPGVNRFRVIDTDSGKTSNEVRVRVG